MSKTHLQKIISDLIHLVDQKKAENIRLYDVAEHNWMTEHVLVVGVKNKIHLKAVLEDIEQFLDSIQPLEDLFATPRVSGDPNSGWVIIDLNSIVVHCVDQEARDYYQMDSLFESQGDVHHY